MVDRIEERATGTSLAPGMPLEPVHLQGVFDTSLHLCLPAERAQGLTELGRAEAHQYEEFGTEFLIYGPRTMAELDTVLSFIEGSLSFARDATAPR